MSALPTDVADLTPEFLTGMLRRAGHDVEISAVAAAPVGSGQMAGSYRLHLNHRAAGLPATMVAKMAVGDTDQRAFAAGVFRNEVLFYQRFAPTVAVPAPQCYAAEISETATEFVLLLEDLAPAVQGDQIAGCPPATVRAIAVAAAGLHGPRWCDETWIDEPTLELPTRESRELLDSVLGPMTDAFRDRFSPGERESALLDWMVAEAGAWLERPPKVFSLIHGDLRVDNVMLGPDGSVTILDWQTLTVGNPLRDIAFLLSTSLTPADRRSSEGDIVADYHAALLDHGVTGYSADRCWQDYLGTLIQAPLIVVLGAGAAMPTERGDRMFSTMLSRSAAAVDELIGLDT